MREIVKKAKQKNGVTINRATTFLYNCFPNSVRKMVLGAFAIVTHFFPKKEYKKFLIFAQGRTGSTVLTDLLHSHTDIFMYDEIFNKRIIKHINKPVAYANTLVRLQYRSPVVGFKVKVYQLTKEHDLDPKKTLQRFLQDGWKIIYLERENKLDHALSNMIANQRGAFHHTEHTGSAVEQLTLELTYDDLREKIERRIERTKQEQKALEGIPYCHIIYEQDLLRAEHHQETANRIFDYLEIPRLKVSTKFKKINNKSRKDLVKNWDEIEKALEQSPYAKYL